MKDIRTYTADIEIRESAGKTIIRGLAVVYGVESVDFGGFREVIQNGALDGADMSDVRALFNHDKNYVLGRTTAGTLILTPDQRGLVYEITPPDSQTIRDLVVEPIKRGDINQSSFGFSMDWSNVEWEEREDEQPIRKLLKIKRLYDVSPVTFPAYEQTAAALRSWETRKKPTTTGLIF